jgi:Ca2+-binding EF-hand superfamily protein
MISSVSSGGYSPMMLSGMRGGGGAPDPTKMQEKLFAKADANGDGAIDKTELTTLMESSGTDQSVSADDLFSRMDADGDGQISQQEATDTASQLLEDLRSQLMQSGRGAMGGMPPPPMGGGQGGMDEEEMFSSIDTDGDGSISKTELSVFFESAPAGNGQSPSVDDIFSRDDGDSDGLISKDEFLSAMEARKSERQGPPPPPPQESASSGESGSGTDPMIAALLQLYQSVGQSSDNQKNETLLSLFA